LSTQTFDGYGSRQSTDGNADPYAGYQGQSGYYTEREMGTASSALELLTFRYYDPSAGRFLTRDPIGYKGDANPYEYLNNEPLIGSDPLKDSSSLRTMRWGAAGTTFDAAASHK
jgi:RHS repeat-associated protein